MIIIWGKRTSAIFEGMMGWAGSARSVEQGGYWHSRYWDGNYWHVNYWCRTGHGSPGGDTGLADSFSVGYLAGVTRSSSSIISIGD